MQRSTLVILQLNTERRALDLSNALIAISGVGHIEVDQSTRTLTVDYDRQYLSEESLKAFVQGSGYPIEGDAGA